MKTCKKGLHQYPKEMKRCPDCQKSRQADWYSKNRDSLIEKSLIYYSKNKAKRKIKYKLWRKKKSKDLDFKAKLNCKKRREEAAKLQRTPPWLTKEHYRQIERYYQTAKWVESILGISIHVDHIIPLQGKNVSGLHVPWNLQLLEAKVNIRKSNNI